MLTLKELRQKAADAKKTARSKEAEYNVIAKKADATDDERAKLAALDAELDKLAEELDGLNADIEIAEKRERRSALFAGTAGTIPALSAGRTLNEPNPETTFGFKSMAEFAVAVRSAQTGGGGEAVDRLYAAQPSTFNQNQGAGGEGFLAPPEYSKQVWDVAFENTDLLAMCNPEPTLSNTVLKPKDEATPWGAVGVQAYWVGESQTLTLSKLALTGEMLQLHKLHAFCAATEEVLTDAPLLQSRLTRQAGNVIKWTAAEAVMWGNGIAKPVGFMNAPSLVTVAADGGQATATITLSNLAKMMARILRTGGRPMWIANQDTIPQLIQLTLGNVPAYLPFNQPIAGSPFEGTLMGYPVMFTEHAQTLGTSGDIVCANMDGYYAAVKQGGIDFATSMHLYFDSAQVAFRWQFRLAGMPFLSKAVSPSKGSNTKSHFVALAARP